MHGHGVQGQEAGQQQDHKTDATAAAGAEASANAAAVNPSAASSTTPEASTSSSMAAHEAGQPAASTTAGSKHTSSSKPGSSSHGSAAGPPPLVKLLIPICVATAALTWLLRRVTGGSSKDRASGSTSGKASTSSSRRGSKQRRQQAAASDADSSAAVPEVPEPASTLAVYASDFQLPTQDVDLVARPAALEGLTCVLAEHIPIQGARIGCGLPELWSSRPTAASHASITQKLLHKGFSITCQGSTQPFNYPTAGTNLRNPAARFRVAGGGATGAAVAVSQQAAHMLVGTDWLGSVRMPAACQGLAAVVCTPGVYVPPSNSTSAAAAAGASAGAADAGSSQPNSATGRSSSSSSGSGSSSVRGRRSSSALEAVGFAAGDMGLLRRVCEHLALPGAADLRGELTQVVVAEDLFALCEPELEPGLLCMKRAVLQWAGQEQAGSVQLLPFLESNCRSWSNLAAAADASVLASVTTGSGKPLPPVLRAITYAAQLLYHHQLAHQYTSEAATAAATPAAAADGSAGTQAGAESAAGLDAAVSEALAAGGRVQQQELDDAWQVLQEVQDLLATAVKHDVVVVLPVTPSPPPRLDAPAPVLQSWLSRCHAFAALTALGGVPSVVVPVGQLPQGGGPLTVGLFGHSRSDTRLITVAEKLTHAAQVEFVKLAEKRAAEAQAAAAAAGEAAQADKHSSSSKGKQQRAQQQAEQQPDPRRLAKAEKAKGRGNEAFKQAKYRDAIKAYSEAAKLDPSNPVYLSNRALCYLRLFSFEAAEADCNTVLAFPELAVGDQVKALLRRGTARIHKNELEGAAGDFRQVLALEPNNRQAREELKALADQSRELAEEQRKAMAARSSSSSSANNAAGSNSAYSANGGLPFGPGSMYPPPGAESVQSALRDPRSAAAADALLREAAASGDVRPEDFEAMRALLQSGSLPVVLGDEGQPVVGPRGEPVIVGPGGQAMAVGPSGGITPYGVPPRRKRAGGS